MKTAFSYSEIRLSASFFFITLLVSSTVLVSSIAVIYNIGIVSNIATIFIIFLISNIAYTYISQMDFARDNIQPSNTTVTDECLGESETFQSMLGEENLVTLYSIFTRHVSPTWKSVCTTSRSSVFLVNKFLDSNIFT